MKKPVKKGGRSGSKSKVKKHVIKKLKTTPSKERHVIHGIAMKRLLKSMKAMKVVMKSTKHLPGKSHPGRTWKVFPRCAKTMKRALEKSRKLCATPSTPMKAMNNSRKTCAKPSTPIKVLDKRRKTCAKPSTPIKAMKKSQDNCAKPSTPVKVMKISAPVKVMKSSASVKVMKASTPIKVMKTSTPVKAMKTSTPMKVMRIPTPMEAMNMASVKGQSGSCRKPAKKKKMLENDSSSDEEGQVSSAASEGCAERGKSRLLLLGKKAKVSRTSLRGSTQKSGSAADALRLFLMNPIGVTSEPAAFQLRCTQRTGEGAPARTVVFVVGGKCRLWKLNQVIAECFDLSEEEFSYEPLKGRPVMGSRFVVTRPQEPGKCSKALICSRRSAIVGGQIACVDDRNHSVAELFRGKSTRDALERLPQDAAQRVCFMSPSVESEVVVTLDGIMLDSYDSHTLFDQDTKKKRPVLDKMRRHCNGRRPLPRIVRSSFLSIAEIEAKNIFMQGSREGPDFLLKIATPWSALHESCRRSQRKPLFAKDGRDFDLNDLCHVNGDVESDAED